MIYVARVTAGQEATLASLIMEKVKKVRLGVDAILVSPSLRGYLMLEASDEATAKMAIGNLPHVKGMLKRTIAISELGELLVPKVSEVVIEKGDVVEVTRGPFKGARAKVVRIDKKKGEATVEFLDMVVAIPVTLELAAIKPIPKEIV